MLQKSYHTKTTDLISQFIHKKQETGFTAGELADYLRENNVNVNKTTVYRNLDKMTDTRQLIKHQCMVSAGLVYQSDYEDRRCAAHVHFECC